MNNRAELSACVIDEVVVLTANVDALTGDVVCEVGFRMAGKPAGTACLRGIAAADPAVREQVEALVAAITAHVGSVYSGTNTPQQNVEPRRGIGGRHGQLGSSITGLGSNFRGGEHEI